MKNIQIVVRGEDEARISFITYIMRNALAFLGISVEVENSAASDAVKSKWLKSLADMQVLTETYPINIDSAKIGSKGIRENIRQVKQQSAEDLLKEWTDKGGPQGWFFGANGHIMGDKPNKEQFLDLIRRARQTVEPLPKG